jgi:tRNA threonylcarbamoyladenosine dehydratase
VLGVNSGIPVVFSTEKPGSGKAPLLPLSEEEIANGQVGELRALPGFRIRILPVLGTMPAAFGYTIANRIICEISGYLVKYSMSGKDRERLHENIFASFQGLAERLPVSKEDVMVYLIEEYGEGRGVVNRTVKWGVRLGLYTLVLE